MSNDASSSTPPEAEAVLDFWLGDPQDPAEVERRGKLWFASTAEQDAEIRARFGPLHAQAESGGLDHWGVGTRSTLALVVLLDQFSRNLYRGTAAAFSNDDRALDIAVEAIDRSQDAALGVVERAFLYMPLQHSEDPADQERSVRLYTELVASSPEPLKAFAGNSRDFAVLHRDIVERFGRFPHRNELLGRRSSDEERRYLEDGGHRFGQG